MIVVTAPASCLGEFCAAIDGLGDVLVVAGSDRSRQASVALGLAALGDRGADTVVLVHDAARPLTPPQVTARIIDAVRAGAGAVIPVLPVTDTLKTVDASGLVTGTPRRADMVAVQTPQGFCWDVLTRAHEAGASLGADEAVAATDDAGLVEAIGGAVHTVAGDERSLKVTRPLDLAIARLLADQDELLGRRISQGGHRH
jgi:2-C-methyl-D-erythritol 4-phosphate cytidylyltransferase